MDDKRDQWIAGVFGTDGTEITDPGVARLLAHVAGFALEAQGGEFLVQPYDPAKDNGITQTVEYGGDDLVIEVPNMGSLVIPAFL